MSFLLVIPHALLGVAGLVLFFFLLYHQPTFYRNNELQHYIYKICADSVRKKFQYQYDTNKNVNDFNLTHQLMFI
jgi:hypothetical protein